MSHAEPMPVIQNKSQQVVSRAMNPRVIYSRVESLQVNVGAGPATAYAVTPPLGNCVWLLGIKCWMLPKAINVANISALSFVKGEGPARALADVMQWKNILPLNNENSFSMSWFFHDGRDEMSWEFSRLYTGESVRFAVIVGRSAGPADQAQVSFVISEG